MPVKLSGREESRWAADAWAVAVEDMASFLGSLSAHTSVLLDLRLLEGYRRIVDRCSSKSLQLHKTDFLLLRSAPLF